MPTGYIPILQIKTKDGKWLPVNAIGGQVASKVLYNNAYPTVEQALDYLFENGTGGGGTGGASTAEDISYTVSQDIQDTFPDMGLESGTVQTGLDLATYYALAGMFAKNISVNLQTSGSTSSISLQNLYDYSILPAIEEAHEHSNKPVLDSLSFSNGKLQYNGSDISVTKDNVISALGYTPKAVSQTISYPGTNVTLEDNTEYRVTNVTTLNLTYPTGNFECWMRLTFAKSGDATVTLPVDTKYLGAVPNFKNGETWELSFKDRVLAAQKVGDGT